jgi:hypothetical protein
MNDIFAEIENSLSRIGSTRVYKQNVGGRVLWFSPLTLEGQEKVTELLGQAQTIGVNIVHETKRKTLSLAIVGIDSIDLRPYRDSPALFLQNERGDKTRVSLDKYLVHKMGDWSAQFIDDAFSVYADIVATDQKENLKEVKFENLKTPAQELKELEEKAATLRESLGLPKLIEATNVPTAQEESVEPEEEESIYNPFATVQRMERQVTASVNQSTSFDLTDLAPIPSDPRLPSNIKR